MQQCSKCYGMFDTNNGTSYAGNSICRNCMGAAISNKNSGINQVPASPISQYPLNPVTIGCLTTDQQIRMKALELAVSTRFKDENLWDMVDKLTAYIKDGKY